MAIGTPTPQAESASRELLEHGFDLSKAQIETADGQRRDVKEVLGNVTTLPAALAAMDDNTKLVGVDELDDDKQTLAVLRHGADSFEIGNDPELRAA